MFDPKDVSSAIRDGSCLDDSIFDRFLPTELQVVSGQYWTPLVVAKRAAEWFDSVGIRTVVDIGSGAGKFCVAAALAGDCRYTGVEQRGHLVDCARELARSFNVDDRVQFVSATFGEAPMPVADAYYVFNPFEENLFQDDLPLDTTIELNPARYRRDVHAMTRHLDRAEIGTYLLTYNGFGGLIPANYREVLIDRKMPNVLRLWRKTKRNPRGGPS